MPKNLDSVNLSNVFHSLRDNEKVSPRCLIKKLISLKKRGVKLVYNVKDKLDKTFGANPRDAECEEIDFEGQKLGLPVNRPKRCLCNKPKNQPKWRSRVSAIGSLTRNSFTKSREPSAPNLRNEQNLQNESEAINFLDRTENLAVILEEELNLIHDSQRESQIKRSRLSVEPTSESHQLEESIKTATPERQQSFGEQRKSSIKSERERKSLPLVIQSAEPTNENALKIEEIEENFVGPEVPYEEIKEFLVKTADDTVEKVQTTAKINVVDEAEEPIQYEIVNLLRRDLDMMEREPRVQRVIRIDHKTLPPDTVGSSEFLSDEESFPDEWKDVPIPVIDEIRRLTKPKRPHKCPKACPCKFTQELIDMYHESRVLSSRAVEISEARAHCSFRMTSSEIDFFKKDTKVCNVMIGETRSRRAEMRELMDMWQESNEKLAVRKKEVFSIVESVEQTEKRLDEVENLLKDWLPEGKMEKLRNTQRAFEKAEQERLETLEDEERTFAKVKIEEIMKKREASHEEEKIREEKRKNQRKQDMRTLENATSLMQKYIDERKSHLIR